jgi:hypothetical protein
MLVIVVASRLISTHGRRSEHSYVSKEVTTSSVNLIRRRNIRRCNVFSFMLF